MSKKTRRHFTSEQKATILRRHLADKVPVSDLCDEYKVQPSVVYGWLSQLLERAPKVFEASPQSPSREKELQKKLELLEQRLIKKDAVIAEISAEYVQLKKELGEL